MQIAHTQKPHGLAHGVVLYGNHPQTGKWFERWFPNEEAAKQYAIRRQWAYETA